MIYQPFTTSVVPPVFFQRLSPPGGHHLHDPGTSAERRAGQRAQGVGDETEKRWGNDGD